MEKMHEVARQRGVTSRRRKGYCNGLKIESVWSFTGNTSVREQGAINTVPTSSRNHYVSNVSTIHKLGRKGENIHPHRAIFFALGPCFRPLVLRLSKKLHGIYNSHQVIFPAKRMNGTH